MTRARLNPPFCRSTSIEHLQQSIAPHSRIAIAYAYLRYSEKRTVRDILVALLHQLLATDDALVEIEQSFHQMKQDGTSYTAKEIISIIKNIVSCLAKVYAVVDGLDEASDEVKDGLLQALPPLGLNLLIFSRHLEMFACHTPDAIKVSIQARTDDIALYISEQFEKNARLKALLGGRPDLAEELSNRIKNQADGMSVDTSVL